MLTFSMANNKLQPYLDYYYYYVVWFFLYFQKLSRIAERRVFNHLKQEDNTISQPIIFI